MVRLAWTRSGGMPRIRGSRRVSADAAMHEEKTAVNAGDQRMVEMRTGQEEERRGEERRGIWAGVTASCPKRLAVQVVQVVQFLVRGRPLRTSAVYYVRAGTGQLAVLVRTHPG
jgi:hypothetical protein